MSTCKAANQYGIPKSTLMDWKNNRYETSKVGRKNNLTDEEEQALKGYNDYMASINHPLSIPAVKAFAWAIAKRSTIPNRFNPETGPGVKARHNLTNRKPDNVDCERSRMGNTTVWKQHFDLLEETIDQLQLRDNPKAIFNCDESMIEDRGQLLSPGKRNIPIQKAKEHGTTSPSMHVFRHQVTLCHPISFSPNLIHLVSMLEMDQMERYTLCRIMGIWTANFFMVLSLNYSSSIQTKLLELNYLFWMDMGRT